MEFRRNVQRNRTIFGAELQRRGRRRCRSYWFCGVGGFVLGAVTGLHGANAIAATTVAVESVVLRHLEHQLANLGSSDPAAVAAISAVVAEERQHHDHSARQEAHTSELQSLMRSSYAVLCLTQEQKTTCIHEQTKKT